MAKNKRREDKAGYILNWRNALQYDARTKSGHVAVGMAYSDFPDYFTGKGSRPTQVTIAAITNMTDKTVAKHVADLEAWGYMVPVGSLKDNVQEYDLTVPARIVVYASLAGRCPFEDRHQVIDEPAKYKQRRRVQSIERSEVTEPVSEPQEAKQDTEAKQPETEPQKPVQRSEGEWKTSRELEAEVKSSKPAKQSPVEMKLEQDRAEAKTTLDTAENSEGAWERYNDPDFFPELSPYTKPKERANRARIEAMPQDKTPVSAGRRTEADIWGDEQPW